MSIARDVEDVALGCFLGACIGDAGALVEAATGASSIPKPMRAAVLDCDTRQGRPRPEFLHGRRVPELPKALLSAAE